MPDQLTRTGRKVQTGMSENGANLVNRRAPEEPRRARLLFLTSLYPPAVGGAAQDSYTCVSVWSRDPRVESLVVLTEKQKGCPWRETLGKTMVLRALPPRDSRYGAGFLYRVISFAATYFLLGLIVPALVVARRANIIVFHARYGRPLWNRYLKLWKTRRVALLTGFTEAKSRRLGHCDAVICFVENAFGWARKNLDNSAKVCFVPLPFERPVPPASFPTLAADGQPFVLFVGEVSRPKGVDLLLEAFRLFAPNHPAYRLLVVGPIRDRTLLRAASDGVSFLGQQAPDATLALISRAEAVVLSSHSEGLPRVCLEAIALGTKVLCPPGVPELARECPHFVLQDLRAESIAKKLEEVLRSEERPSYPFERHEPRRTAGQLLELCLGLL